MAYGYGYDHCMLSSYLVVYCTWKVAGCLRLNFESKTLRLRSRNRSLIHSQHAHTHIHYLLWTTSVLLTLVYRRKSRLRIIGYPWILRGFSVVILCLWCFCRFLCLNCFLFVFLAKNKRFVELERLDENQRDMQRCLSRRLFN